MDQTWMTPNALLMTLTLISSCLAGADSKASVATLAWMSGCWEGTLVNRHLEEYWTSPSG